MEKFFALLLTTTVLLGLSACSDKPDGQVEQFPPTVYDGTGDVAAGAAPSPPTRTGWKTAASGTATGSCRTERMRGVKGG